MENRLLWGRLFVFIQGLLEDGHIDDEEEKMLSARCDLMDPKDPVLLAFLKTGCNRYAFLERINHLLLDANATGESDAVSPTRAKGSENSFVVQATPLSKAPGKPATLVQAASVPPSGLRLETGSASLTNEEQDPVQIHVELCGLTYTSYSAVRTTSYQPRLLPSSPEELTKPPPYRSLARTPNLMEITPAACSDWLQVSSFSLLFVVVRGIAASH
jgi:hypothetical protein